MIPATPRHDWSPPLPMAGLATSKQPDPGHAFAQSLSQNPTSVAAGLTSVTAPGEEPLREAFRDFVGQTMFGQMLQSMRSTVGKPAYFHGGRGEEVFQQQLDQLLVEELSESSASSVADPMFDLFQLQRSQ